jgi:hypothetical protein
MNLDPVQFQNAQFENASLMVEFCRETLETCGFAGEARRLDHIVVNNPQMAGTAIAILMRMQLQGEALEARSLAVRALKRLVAAPALRGAA